MKNKILLPSFLLHLSKSCCITGLFFLVVFQSCKKDDPPPASTTITHPKQVTKVDEMFKVLVLDRKTMNPLSNIWVEINTRGGFIRRALTNDSGRVQFPISEADSGWMEIRSQISGYSLFWNKISIDGKSIAYTIYMDQLSYLRCHVINQAPVSISERIDIFTNTEYNYKGPTDITFIEPSDSYKQSIECKLYWNNALDSSYSIPIHLIPGDTTDITITF